MLKFAFIGFRHYHVLDVYKRVTENPDMEAVALCEEDADAAAPILQQGSIEPTHSDYQKMLDEVQCDAVVVGDYYGKRGKIIIDALKRGKHVLADKPLCTSLEEFDTIQRLANERGLQVGLMLDLRDSGHYIKARELVRAGTIGEIQSVYVGGQHALRPDVRPGWYFEPGKHGGTINDIAVHGLDIVEWITGLTFSEVTAARTWNAMAKQYPDFRDGAQFLMNMDNGCGVMGDVSYFAPADTGGSSFDPSWRVTLWGSEGVIETSHSTPVKVWRTGKPVEVIENVPDDPGGYLTSFAASVAGDATNCKLTTQQSLRATEVALKVQKAADAGLYAMRIWHRSSVR